MGACVNELCPDGGVCCNGQCCELTDPPQVCCGTTNAVCCDPTSCCGDVCCSIGNATAGAGGETCPQVSLTATAVLFTNSGPIQLWPTGGNESPPPRGWHQDLDDPLGGFPVRFPFNGRPVMNVRFRVTQNHVCGSIKIRAKLGLIVLGESTVDISGAVPRDVTIVGLGGDGIILESYAIRALSTPVNFSYSTDDGQTWTPCGSLQPSKWYIMPSLDTLGQVPYDFGFDKVVEYAGGNSLPYDIVEALNSGIAWDITYDTQEPDPRGHILHVYDAYKAQCSANANLLLYLTSVTGTGGSIVNLWGGSIYYQMDFFCYGTWTPTFRTLAPANDLVAANPHFTFHAQVSALSNVFDPSYGTMGLPVFDEVCPTYSRSPTGEFHVPPAPGEPVSTCGQCTDWSLPAESQRVTVPCSAWQCPH